MDLPYQQGGHGQLCAELKMLRINRHNEIRQSEEVMLTFYFLTWLFHLQLY